VVLYTHNYDFYSLHILYQNSLVIHSFYNFLFFYRCLNSYYGTGYR